MANAVFVSGMQVVRMPQSKVKIDPDQRQLFIYAYPTVDVVALRNPIFGLADTFDLYHVLRLRGGDWALGAGGLSLLLNAIRKRRPRLCDNASLIPLKV